MNGHVSRRNRSFGGCATCRNRRTKCDEARPKCVVCQKAGLVCGQYGLSLFFGNEEPQDTHGGRFRRPLFSVEARARMSDSLVEQIPPHLVLWNLARIDEYGGTSHLSDDGCVSHGPFGVFKLLKNDDYIGSRGNVSNNERRSAEPAVTPMDPNVSQHMNHPPGGVQWMEDCNLRVEISDMWSFETDILQEIDPEIATIQGRSPLALESLAPRSLPPPIKLFSEPSPAACSLLRHYIDTVLTCLTPFSHRKTPWHILFVPLVKNCLAGLALKEEIDSASLCAFYGTLTIGSISLGNQSGVHSWESETNACRRMALGYMLKSMQTAYDSPKKTKYKSSLIALLTMAQDSILQGAREEAETCLLEAERLIRIRGLNRSKSRKVRLLHHCYAYERIMFESTSHLYGSTMNDRCLIRRAIEASGAMCYSQDSLTFRFRRCGNLEADMLQIKSKEQGENDLHLEIPGTWPSTLYPEIFGIPESYVLLISMIIRLAKERDAEDIHNDTGDRLNLKDFTARAKSIEKCVKQQRTPLPQEGYSELNHLNEAMYHAINIYFYRRIHDVDPSLLQHQVADVREAITRYVLRSPSKERGAVRLIWPALIAAIEAEDEDSRKFFSTWFSDTGKRTGLPVFESTLFFVEQTWERQSASPEISLDDFIRDFGDDVLLEQLMSAA